MKEKAHLVSNFDLNFLKKAGFWPTEASFGALRPDFWRAAQTRPSNFIHFS